MLLPSITAIVYPFLFSFDNFIPGNVSWLSCASKTSSLLEVMNCYVSTRRLLQRDAKRSLTPVGISGHHINEWTQDHQGLWGGQRNSLVVEHMFCLLKDPGFFSGICYWTFSGGRHFIFIYINIKKSNLYPAFLAAGAFTSLLKVTKKHWSNKNKLFTI